MLLSDAAEHAGSDDCRRRAIGLCLNTEVLGVGQVSVSAGDNPNTVISAGVFYAIAAAIWFHQAGNFGRRAAACWSRCCWWC